MGVSRNSPGARRVLYDRSMQTKSLFFSLPILALVVVSVFGVTATQAACSSTAKTCSSSEESSCTNTYSTCISAAAAAADKAACQKCVDDYCNCYDKCGNSCDKSKLSGQC